MRLLAAAHKAAYEQGEILKHFQEFCKLCEKYDIQPKQIWNFDKTSFRIGCLYRQIVFTLLEKEVYLSDPNNQELVTSIKGISAAREFIPLIIILLIVVLLKKHFQNNIKGSTLFAVSESSYINDLLSYK